MQIPSKRFKSRGPDKPQGPAGEQSGCDRQAAAGHVQTQDRRVRGMRATCGAMGGAMGAATRVLTGDDGWVGVDVIK